MKCFLTTDPDADVDALLAELKDREPVEVQNLVASVAASETTINEGGAARIVLVDCGCKESIATELGKRLEVVRVPWDTPADEILDHEPAGVLISNGPGDPAHPELMANTVETAKALMTEVPTYGICLGHQVLSLAAGAETFKLKFGHRGANQPVRRIDDKAVFITSQNHGFAVDPDSLDGTVFQVTEVNASDGTVEGVSNRDGTVAAVQYHPEAHPGPLDAEEFFDRLADRLGGGR